jgi:hypothetical protein
MESRDEGIDLGPWTWLSAITLLGRVRTSHRSGYWELGDVALQVFPTRESWPHGISQDPADSALVWTHCTSVQYRRSCAKASAAGQLEIGNWKLEIGTQMCFALAAAVAGYDGPRWSEKG